MMDSHLTCAKTSMAYDNDVKKKSISELSIVNNIIEIVKNEFQAIFIEQLF